MRARRTTSVALLALCVGTALPLTAALADSGPPVVKSNWYWAENGAVVAGQAAPTLPDQALAGSNVPAGDLAVGFTNDNLAPADKVTALGFDLTTIPAGSTFSKLAVTVPIDSAATQVQSAQPEIAACENIDSFLDGPGGAPLATAPPYSSPSCVKGVFTAGKGYTFDLTAMANDWSFGAPSEGISLVPATTATGSQPFSVVLQGENAITTSVAFAVPTGVDVAVPPLLPAAGQPSVTQPVAQLPALQPTVPQLQAPAPQALPPAALLPQVQQLPAPQVNPPPQPRQVRVNAAGYVAPTGVPSTTWWLAVLGGLGLLGATRLVLADPLTPVPADPRRRRFADVVKAQSRTTTP